jgi:hypothetical protein
MRRYMQSGGINPAITMIMGLALAFVLEKSPKLMALLALLGMAEMPQTMRGGGLFGAAQTKTIAVSKDTVINSLNKLKDAFKADTNAGQITECVDKLVAKIKDAPASAPENVASEDITKSVSDADDTTQALQGEAFDAMVKRVLRTKIDMLKDKYEKAIRARIESFKRKYNLGDDDVNCMNVLKAAVLADLIKKKEELMTGIMANQNVNRAIDTAKNAAAVAAAAKEKAAAAATTAKNMGTAAVSRFGSFFGK